MFVLLSFSYIYFNDALNSYYEFEAPYEHPSDKEPQTLFDELIVFKNKEPPKKEFGIEDVVFVTAFSENHFVEAL